MLLHIFFASRNRANVKVHSFFTEKTDVKRRLFFRIFLALATVNFLIRVTPDSIDRPFCVWAAEFLNNNKIIKIQQGDTLSQSLDRQFPNRNWRIWGDKGILSKIAKLNPHIEDLNHLKPGQLVAIGDIDQNLEKYSKVVSASRRDQVTRNRASRSIAESDSTPLIQPVAQETPVQTTEQPAVQATPQPAVQTTSLPIATQKDPVLPTEPKRFGWFTIAPSFSYSLLTATDKSSGVQAVLPSNLNSGAAFQWGQHWNQNFESSLNLAVEQTSFAQPTSGESLDNASHTLTQFSLQSSFSPSGVGPEGGFSLLSGVQFAQRLFIRGTSLTSDTLDAVMVPELQAGLSYQFPILDPFTFSLYVLGSLYLPASTSSYSIDMGNGYKTGLTLKENLSRKLVFSGNAYYSNDVQNSSIADQSLREIGISFGISFRLDPPDSGKPDSGK
jgi:hypothetical protein